MKQMLTKILKTIASDVRQAAVPGILFLLVGGTTGLLYFYQGALALSIQIANTAMPLWATIFLIALCCLYTYVKVVKIRSKLNQSGQASSSPPQVKFHANILWLMDIDDKDPYCPTCYDSDQKLIHMHNSTYRHIIDQKIKTKPVFRCPKCDHVANITEYPK